MFPFRLYAATGDAVAQIDGLDGERADVALNLEGRGVMCVAVDPHDPARIFAGTSDRGVYRTRDGGEVWESVGEHMADARVLSITPRQNILDTCLQSALAERATSLLPSTIGTHGKSK